MEYSQLNLSKYNRFFAFGCSFTDYFWPTWADIIGREFPNCYYNYGSTGSCNGYIFKSLIEANQKHLFTSNDLIIICWTEILRDEGWRPDTKLQGCGSILHNHQYTTYTEDDLNKIDYCDFLKRDLEYISSSLLIAKGLNFDLKMFSINNIKDTNHYLNKTDPKIFLNFYKEAVESLGPSYEETVDWFNQKGILIDNDYDIHPSPKMHLDHLMNLFPNLSLSTNTIRFVDEIEVKTRNWQNQIKPNFDKISAERLKEIK